VTRLLTLMLHDVYRSHPSESGFPGRAADGYKLSVAEFEAQITGLARARTDRPILVTGEAPSQSPAVPFAITADDGGVSYYTTVADRIEALGWRGHCFVTTGAIGRPGFLGAQQIRELHSRGHVIGSHSVVGEEVLIGSVPGGAFSPRVACSALEAGLRILFTSEPETRVAHIGGCTVVGRFAFRAGCRPDFARRLGRLEVTPRLREWILWNTKKRLKPLVAR
jgi:hypothetical protein